MGGTVAGLDMVLVSLCEATTGWTGSPTPALNDITISEAREGSRCLVSYSASAVARSADFTYAANQDLSAASGRAVYFWFSFAGKKLPDFGANGMRIRLEDVDAKWAEWDIFGGNTLPHVGWMAWCVKPTETPSRHGGALPDLTKIRKIGWRCGATVTVPAKVYIYWDAIRYGKGLQITGGTSTPGDEATFEDFITSEETNAWGVFEKYGGIYYVQGRIQIGAAGATTYFKDLSQAIVFKDAFVGDEHYEIRFVQGTATRAFFGTKSGEAGISGCLLKPASETKRFTIIATDALTEFGLYGSTFVKTRTISLPAYSAARAVLNSSFEGCEEVVVNDCIVENCNFISAKDEAIILPSGNTHKITKSNFISNPNAVRIPSAGTYGFNYLKFTANTIDVDNTSGGAVTVNCTESDPSQGKTTGNTTIINTKTLTLTGLIAGSDVRILEAGTQNVKQGGQTDDSGTYFEYQYSYAAATYVDIVILHLDYEYFRLENYLLLNANVGIPIPLRKDRWYENPP